MPIIHLDNLGMQGKKRIVHHMAFGGSRFRFLSRGRDKHYFTTGSFDLRGVYPRRGVDHAKTVTDDKHHAPRS